MSENLPADRGRLIFSRMAASRSGHTVSCLLPGQAGSQGGPGGSRRPGGGHTTPKTLAKPFKSLVKPSRRNPGQRLMPSRSGPWNKSEGASRAVEHEHSIRLADSVAWTQLHDSSSTELDACAPPVQRTLAVQCTPNCHDTGVQTGQVPNYCGHCDAEWPQ